MLVSFHYHPRGTLIERIDPRARWITSVLLLFTITLFWDIRFLLPLLGLTLGQYALARLTWRETRRAWTLIFIIMSTMVIVNTLITSAGTIGEVKLGSHPLFALTLSLFGRAFHFTLTVERAWFAVTQVVRILAISALFLVIPFTMDPRQYGATFRGLGLPDRLAYSLDLAFRFLPTLGRDFQITLDAQRARGYEVEKLRGGLIAQIRKLAPLVVPVTMNAILSGEDITNAMDLRCFGLQRRTWLESLSYRWTDYLFIAFGAALLLAGLLAKQLGYGAFWVPPFLLNQ